MTTATVSAISCRVNPLSAFLTAKYPVGNMSAISKTALSEMLVGTLNSVESASGTRT